MLTFLESARQGNSIRPIGSVQDSGPSVAPPSPESVPRIPIPAHDFIPLPPSILPQLQPQAFRPRIPAPTRRPPHQGFSAPSVAPVNAVNPQSSQGGILNVQTFQLPTQPVATVNPSNSQTSRTQPQQPISNTPIPKPSSSEPHVLVPNSGPHNLAPPSDANPNVHIKCLNCFQQLTAYSVQSHHLPQ